MLRLGLASLFAACGTTLSAQCVSIGAPGLNGCGGVAGLGISILSCVGAPTIGSTSFGFTASAPCTVGTASWAVLLVGTCRTPLVLFNYGPGGMCGPSQATCAMTLDIVVALPAGPLSGGLYSYAAPIPAIPQLVGLLLCAQEAHYCPAPALACVGASQGMRVTLQ
jgi:hypothetical protein